MRRPRMPSGRPIGLLLPEAPDAPHEPAGPLRVDADAEQFGVAPQQPLIPGDDAQAARGLLTRQIDVGDEHVAQEDHVVILPEDAVERLDAPLVADQVIAAPAFEQPHVKPVILDVAPPGVEMRRLRPRPGDDHHPARPAVALLEARADGAEALGAHVPVLDALALAAQRAGGDLEDAALGRVAIRARPVPDDALPGGLYRPRRERLPVAARELVERLDDAAAVGDRREHVRHGPQVVIHRPVGLVEHGPDEANDGPYLLDPPPCVVDRFVTLRIADGVQLGDGDLELPQHDAPDLGSHRRPFLQTECHATGLLTMPARTGPRLRDGRSRLPAAAPRPSRAHQSSTAPAADPCRGSRWRRRARK